MYKLFSSQMMAMMKPANGSTNGTSSGTSRILDAPVSLGSLGGARNADAGIDSIWINKKEDDLVSTAEFRLYNAFIT